MEAPFLEKLKGMPHVDKIRLHVSFDPARALAYPVLQSGISLFKRGRVENDRLHVIAFEAQTQVAVLGDIVSIPAAQGAKCCRAEVIGCSA